MISSKRAINDNAVEEKLVEIHLNDDIEPYGLPPTSTEPEAHDKLLQI